MLTQAELEAEMVDGGRERMTRMMERNEGAGGAVNNPYASAILKRFVMPMAAMIEADITTPTPGRNKAHVTLLKGMDAQAIAYLAVRHTLNMLMESGEATARSLTLDLGKAAYSELILSIFEIEEPDLFYVLTQDLDRRMSQDERYRVTIFKMQAKKAGLEFPEWGLGGATQVGGYLVNLLEILGMVETIKITTTNTRGNPKTAVQVRLGEEVTSMIGSIKDYVLEACPMFLPCVEKPRDWTSVADGGWHTMAMRRVQPFAVKANACWSELHEYDMSTPLAAINTLQSVKWKINRRILATIKEVARYFDTEEIVSFNEPPKPERPYWLTEDMKRDQMNADENAEFREWRRATAQWFTDQKLRNTKYGRFNNALRVGEKMAEYPELYFVYFADFRGRLYAQTTGVSPQGSDMQKALLCFADGKPLDTPDAVKWFKINGANKYGFDKASLDDRAAWVDERHDLIYRAASDPITYRDDWASADSPLQYLAWAFEYKAWWDAPDTFKSHLPVGMDGSCNGLQNFSAMLRDEVGGRATNLVPLAKPADIYQTVADVTAQKLRNASPMDVPEDEGDEDSAKRIRYAENFNRFRRAWLDHGITRSLVKRSVMTKPYGSTRFSCADFIVADYLKVGKAPEFAKEDYHHLARFLSRFVWEAISEVVIKADEAMDWLQRSASKILKENDHIRWVTPTGFPVIQRYAKQEKTRIRTRLCGNALLSIRKETADPDGNQHKNGIAPNMVHSLDASHMALTALAAGLEGMALAMIHDDFGTHAADAQRFYTIIRETFVAMYENNDPLGDFADQYGLAGVPQPGRLDLRQVLASPYFFS